MSMLVSLKILLYVHLIRSSEGACGPLRVPYFGVLHGSCEGSAGDVCSLTCAGNFKVHGSSTKTCNSTSAKWEPGGPFSCQDRNFRCRGLRPPRNGNFRHRCSSYVGSSCYIGCSFGYFLSGSERLICMSSLRWQPRKPDCKPLLCPPLPPPQNGFLPLVGCKRNIGSHCEFSCTDGYRLFGSKFRSCTAAGVWTGKQTRCAKTCHGLAPRINGRLWNECWPGVDGKACHVICNKGFTLNGSRDYVTCTKHGTWNSQLPSCIRIHCADLDPPASGNFYGNCKPGIYGMPCIFTCNYGYRLNGPENSVCTADKEWSNKPPTCEKIICESVPLENVAKLDGNCQPGLPDKWCNVDCVPSFKTVNQRNVTCLLSGKWSPEIPLCKQRTKCLPLDPPENGFLDKACTFGLNSACHQICYPDYVAIGTPFLKCLPSGVWDGVPRKCIHKSQYTEDYVKNDILSIDETFV